MYLRVGMPDQRAFQLRPGVRGISIFDREGVDPPLSDNEVLATFREGSVIIERDRTDIQSKGLTIHPVLGEPGLPDRLRQAHAEIRPGPAMTRGQFKTALKELE
jgi:hypothetical protein